MDLATSCYVRPIMVAPIAFIKPVRADITKGAAQATLVQATDEVRPELLRLGVP